MGTFQTVLGLVVGMLGLGLSTLGCVDRELSVTEPSTQSAVVVSLHQLETTKVDLLFVIDNSGSMSEEQEILSKQIKVLAEELIHPTFNGETTPPPVEDLHIGIISTNLGTGGYQVINCVNSDNGDNGVLWNEGQLEGCRSSYAADDCSDGSCPWLSHTTDNPDDGSSDDNPPIWEDFGCIATIGTDGCGYEQPLEAALRALTVQAQENRPNEGFLRDDSLLAIIFVSDEDDCSADDVDIYNPIADNYGDPNTRCAMHPEALFPIRRYVEGFRKLKVDPENMIVVAAITGVPTDNSWNPGDPIEQLAELVAPDPDVSDKLLPSCSTTMGFAYPPVRFTELVYAFEGNGILESICRDDWTPALVAITRKIHGAIIGKCMPTALASTSSGACKVVETLVDDRPCPNPASSRDGLRASGWHWDLELDEEGRRRCEILPADYDGDGCPDGAIDCHASEFVESLQGWFYDTTNPSCEHGMVRFTQTDVTNSLSDVRFECQTALCPLRRQCVSALDEAADCDPLDPAACGSDQVCIRHNSGDICGWTTVTSDDGHVELRALTCSRCSQTLGDRCPSVEDLWSEEVTGQPLVTEGGCCAEGFHCDSGQCVPDRSTTCE